MEKRLLTDKTLEALKPGAARYMIGDTKADGLLVQVGTTGVRSFLWRGRLDGKVKVITLGRYPIMSLVTARERAGEIAVARAAGINPIAAKAAHAAATAILALKTVDWLFEEYMKAEGQHHRTAQKKRQRYAAAIKPAIGILSIYDVDHDHLHAILTEKAKLYPIGSSQVQKLLGRMFAWAVSEGRSISGLKSNPAQYVKKLHKDSKRRRYVDDREIGYFYNALAGWTSQLAPILRLLMLTGCRVQEVAGARWDEIDLEKSEWLIPSARTKNQLEHLIPLPAQAVTLLRGIERHDTSPNVFYSRKNPQNCFSGFSRAFNSFEKAVAAIANENGRTVQHWTMHDIRRTVSTGMSSLKGQDDMPLILPVVVEAAINHATGERSGVAGIYNRHSYYREKRAAYRLWADYIDAIVDGVKVAG